MARVKLSGQSVNLREAIHDVINVRSACCARWNTSERSVQHFRHGIIFWMSYETIEPTTSEEMTKSIAQIVLGISTEMDPDTARLTAHETLTGEKLTLDEWRAEATQHESLDLARDWHAIPPNDRERKIVIGILNDIIGKDKMAAANLLGNWPHHQQLFDTHVPPTTRDDIHTSLLIGAHHSLTARTFEVLSREVYGADRAIVMDIAAGKDLMRHGTFLYGDATAIPLKDSSVDIIQTNQLFNWLSPALWQDDLAVKEENARRVINEVARVLRPGGHLSMCENAIGAHFDESPLSPYNQSRVAALRALVHTRLSVYGFTNVAIEEGFMMNGSSYLFNQTSGFDETQRIAHPIGVGVYAQLGHI